MIWFHNEEFPVGFSKPAFSEGCICEQLSFLFVGNLIGEDLGRRNCKRISTEDIQLLLYT